MMASIFLVFFVSILCILMNKEKIAISFVFLGLLLILFMLKYHATDALNLVF